MSSDICDNAKLFMKTSKLSFFAGLLRDIEFEKDGRQWQILARGVNRQ